MKTRTLCVLLALVMVLGLFAACGSTAAPAGSAGSAETAEAAEASSAEDTADAGETAAAPAAEETGAEEASAEDAEPAETGPAGYEQIPYELPLTDTPETFTMFTSASSNAIIEKEDNLVWKTIQERTGIDIEFTEVSTWSYTEQFMLMVAGGDWCDMLVNVRTTYTGGLGAALNEEVILDLAQYTDYFPNYYNLINSDIKVLRDTTLGDGEIGAFYAIFEQPRPVEAGLLMRGDWLDALGLDSPGTVDEYYEALKAMNSEYGAVMHLPVNGVMADQAILSAYEVAGFFIDAGFFQAFSPYTVQDDQVYCGFQQDGFREYLKTIHKWYAEKLIDQDFISSTNGSFYLSDASECLSGLLNDKYCLWGDSADVTINYTNGQAIDPNFEARPTPLPTVVKGDDVKCGENLSRIDMDYYSLSTSCHDPELACQFFDYNYTEEGYMLQNWGVEGETYVTNPDGSHTYTDLILNNPDYTVLEARTVYLGGGGTLRPMEAYHALHNEFQMECFDVWNSNFTAEYSIPGNMVMTTEESTEWGPLTADLVTYLNQNVAQFMVGTKDPNDDKQWDAFQADLKSLGLDRCNEIEQQVYERWARIA